MTISLRRVHLEARFNISTPILNILSARASFGLDTRYATASFVTAYQPAWTHGDTVELEMGAGDNNITRFVGYVREFQYSPNPFRLTTVCHGILSVADEYENSDDPNLLGGLDINDLLGTSTGTSSDIVQAALTLAGVAFDPVNIGGTPTLYGSQADEAFIWANGANDQNDIQEGGESALSYIERYDAIDAEYTAGTPDTGGRYRTFESLAGEVYRVRVSQRPQYAEEFTLTEEVDILDGHFERSTAKQRTYFVVSGYDYGDGTGPVIATSPSSPPTPKRTYRFSSPMIEREADADPGDGMSCETVANALSLDWNMEVVEGWVLTHRDDAFGLAQGHLIDTPSHLPGRLGLAERLPVQSLEVTVDDNGFRQRLSYRGGGAETEVATR